MSTSDAIFVIDDHAAGGDYTLQLPLSDKNLAAAASSLAPIWEVGRRVESNPDSE